MTLWILGHIFWENNTRADALSHLPSTIDNDLDQIVIIHLLVERNIKAYDE